MANAFHAIVPQSGASTSSSSKKACYDVFINHRGKDVKRTLASTIYNMLHLMGVKVFLDQEELEVGESFPEAIEEAMRSASVHVAIFSHNYAESPWCLEELSLMVEIEVTIIPVFFRVQPNDLRYVTKGIFADAFRQHRGKRKYNSEEPRYTPHIINKWEEALNRVSDRTGFLVDCDYDEGKLLREIVDAVLCNMKKVPLDVAVFPVGLDEAVQDFESKIGSSIGSQNARIVGIVGMGGSGKTTLAKELYNRKCSSFTRSTFLFNVRDAASKSTLHTLQEKLLKDFRIKHSTLDHKDQGIRILEEDFTTKAVLIVLDDVDHVDQMHALLPPNLGRGSLVIVTTRVRQILTSYEIYDMKLLGASNSKELFYKHAFPQPYSQPGFEHTLNFHDLIERFVKACKGLPLSLKVLGAMVNGQSKAYWEDQLQKISRLLPDEITDCLKLSYHALDSQVQQMFLDVSCLFIGEPKNQVVEMWYGLGWSAQLGWQTLVNKCLVVLDKYNRIEMHDHLRDMGREIARDVSPARIWEEEQIKDGRTPIRGIVADSFSLEHRMDSIKRQDLAELKLLSVSGNNFTKKFAKSRDLVWLRLREFDGASLPGWLSLAHLRVLGLYKAEHLETLWQENVEPPSQLREVIIKLKENLSFRGLPRSIGRLEHLKKIHISGTAGAMQRLPKEFCDLKSLEDLQLVGFPCLSSLPVDFGRLTNLRSLHLDDTALEELPHSLKQLTALQYLSIERCPSFTFTSEMLDVLECMTQLQLLSFQGCSKLEELPHLTTQVSLRVLSLYWTGLRELPNNMCQLTNLKTLWIGGDKLTKVPESLEALSSLTSLSIFSCKMWESLPESLGRLSNLKFLCIRSIQAVEIGLGIGSPSGCNLKSLKRLILRETGVYKISIPDDCCPSLESLYLWINYNLREIETLPRNVRHISVEYCRALKSMRGISGLLHLERLEVANCPVLEVVPFPSCMHSAGHKVRITGCPKVPIIDEGTSKW